jgi:hypothetical protein
VAGLLPDVFWSLTWNDYDSLLFNHYYRQQQMQSGHRAVALQLYNAVGSFSQGFKPLKEADYWPLSLLDPAPKPIDPAATATWWAKMEALAAKSGKRFPTAQA